MADIRQNLEWWKGYDWTSQGESWSAAWGGSDAQFFASILPRIRMYIPSKNILEIAPGFGRWTQYLINFSDEYTGIDLNEECVTHCKNRFSNSGSDVNFYVNDGKSLANIKDDSVDFVFSFDSLVHANAEVLEAYLEQLKNKFTTEGVGFFHHSNLGSFPERGDSTSNHYRDEVVTSDLFKTICERHGLVCISQEVINWGGDKLIDCLSVFTMPSSSYKKDYAYIENNKFMEEASYIRELSSIYGR